jgi:hypothetical protein
MFFDEDFLEEHDIDFKRRVCTPYDLHNTLYNRYKKTENICIRRWLVKEGQLLNKKLMLRSERV